LSPVYWLSAQRLASGFPPVEQALREPDGLLAVGGDLEPTRIVEAYRQGIFPWFGAGQPILWWSPDPRTVLLPEHLHVSRSLRRTLARAPYRITFDSAFARVLTACAAPRADQDGTWLTPEMQTAYRRLHAAGHAHSVEAWEGNELVGGLYGLAVGCVFFGESMFARRTDASKVAFVHLVQSLRATGFTLVDCQVHTRHLESLGARPMPRADFTSALAVYCALPPSGNPWSRTSMHPWT